MVESPAACAKCSFKVCGCEFPGKILPQSCAVSLAAFSGSEAREKGLARIMGSQVRGAEGDRNQEAKSVYRGEI